VARAAARRIRGAPTALADIEHAQALGAAVPGPDVVAAKLALAIAELRHSDATRRANGRAILAQLATLAEADGAWRGAMASATPDEHGRFGAWLWGIGARREAYEQLSLWKRTSAQAGPIENAYDVAHAWWTGGPIGMSSPPPAPPASDVEPVELADAPIVAAARYAHARFAGAPPDPSLLEVARAYRREPAVADRLAFELVAAQVDEAAGHAALGALFDALGDPARARAQWQAAVDASPEPTFIRGLAETVARAGDGSAALIFATQAAAAWGDPAVVWISVGDVLESVGAHVDALVCAHSAIDLAGPDQLPRALDLAIEASHELGRQTQVDALRLQRVAAELPHTAEPTDPAAAILAYRTLPTAGTIARMWVATRTHPGDLEVRLVLQDALPADDPRRATVVADLVALAGDPDPERGLAAALAVSARGR
jgi:tetratricopeptide (TPR) repeat protein